MDILKDLLTSYYISKEYNKESYYSIKDGLKEITPFLKDKLGYNPVVRGEFIKLEKLPGNAESFMGIEEFTDNKEYVFLMLILMFLEDKVKEEQFLLSHITDFIASNRIGDEVDWTHYATRRSLIKVLKFCINHKIIIVNDGDEESFIKDNTKEILFESNGISKYMVRAFSSAIDESTKYEDLLDSSVSDIENDKGVMRRQRVYRNLLLSPIVYKDEATPEDYEYIRNYRGIISADFEKYLGLKLQVHRNGALLVPEEDNSLKGRGFKVETFPKNNGLSDFVMIICSYLNKEIKSNIEKLTKDDIYIMEKEIFEDLLDRVRKEKGEGLSKDYREGTFGKIVFEVIEYMERLKMIEESGDKIIIYPLCGKVVGDYPTEFNLTLKEKEETYE